MCKVVGLQRTEKNTMKAMCEKAAERTSCWLCSDGMTKPGMYHRKRQYTTNRRSNDTTHINQKSTNSHGTFKCTHSFLWQLIFDSRYPNITKQITWLLIYGLNMPFSLVEQKLLCCSRSLSRVCLFVYLTLRLKSGKNWSSMILNMFQTIDFLISQTIQEKIWI